MDNQQASEIYKMVNKPIPLETEKPEHIQMADKMAIELCERFNPDEQESALKHIYSFLKERRFNELKSAEERLQILVYNYDRIANTFSDIPPDHK